MSESLKAPPDDPLVDAMLEAYRQRREVAVRSVCIRLGIPYCEDRPENELRRISMYANIGFVLVSKEKEFSERRKRGRKPKIGLQNLPSAADFALQFDNAKKVLEAKERRKIKDVEILELYADYLTQEGGGDIDVKGTLQPKLSRGRTALEAMGIATLRRSRKKLREIPT